MHEKLRAALSRRHVIGIAVVGSAGLALAIAVAGASAAENGGAGVAHLAIDGRDDAPLGVDDVAPRLSWQVTSAPRGWMQSAYQIRAARSVAELARGPLLWDSGKVRSGAQNDIPWGGAPLPSRQAVAWQVRVWSARGDATAWSDPATWEMGLLNRSDWGDARWIEHPGRGVAEPLPNFARAFTVDGQPPVKARLYVSAVGLFDAELDGEPVTDEVLAPGNSNYQLSAEYRTYDVTRLVRPGANTLGIALGHGTALVTRSITPRRAARRRTAGGRASSRAAGPWRRRPRRGPPSSSSPA
jgi:alpha-L-rhamnosidase